MKKEDIVLCSKILNSTVGFHEVHIRVSDILNKLHKSDRTGSDALYRGIELLQELELITIPSVTEKGHPKTIFVTPKGNDVLSIEDGLKALIQEKQTKEQEEADRLSKSHELTKLQLSKIKEELESKIMKNQNEFFQKSIADLNNKLDERARAIEKKLKTTTIRKNKMQMVTIIASIILSILAFSKSMGWI